MTALRSPRVIEIPGWVPEPWMIDDDRSDAPRDAPRQEIPWAPMEEPPAPPSRTDDPAPRGVLILDI